ncbi:MAG TPA: HAD hydrolase-like protein [Gemmataceae bacterium]|nr:HAD hydrolase-like protein [Gemmataceae bacterium]
MHVCLFDIDGTLISSGGAGKAALAAALRAEFGVDHFVEQVQLSGRTDRAIVRDLFRLHDIEDTPAARERFFSAYLARLPDCLARLKGAVLPGIASFLQYLSERDDVAVGLLTGNVRAGARLKLGHYKLWHHFAFGGFGDHHHDRDQVAQEALREIHTRFDGTTPPDRVWVIGDTPLDVRCARCIGVRSLAVATGWHTLEELTACKPDLALADLSDPTPLLAAW